MVGHVATGLKWRYQPENLTKKCQISKNLPHFQRGSGILNLLSLAHYCAGQRNALWGPFETMTGKDIAGANGEITNFRYLIVIVRGGE